jgi:hypothetical protein
MHNVDVIASLIDRDPEKSISGLLYEYIDENPRLRMNIFLQFCGSRGVDLMAEEVMNMLAADTNYLFTEGVDRQGRFWDVTFNEGYTPYTMQGGDFGGSGSTVPQPYGDEQGDMAGVTDVVQSYNVPPFAGGPIPEEDLGKTIAASMPAEDDNPENDVKINE